MTRKDYILIARVIRESSSIEEIIKKFCEELKRENPAFNKERFQDEVGKKD